MTPLSPAPPQTLHLLHVLAGVAAHVATSLAMAWPVLTLAAEAAGRGGGDTSLRRLAVWMARRTPGAVVIATLLSVPVFLLDVTRHGEAVLAAAAHMGWWWLSLVPLLLAGTGASFWVALRRRGAEPSTLRPFLPDAVESYLLAFRRRGLERPGLVVTVVCVAAFGAIAFILSAHTVLVLRPELWGPAAGPPRGFRLPLDDPQLLPRLVFAVLSSLAVAGFAVAWHGADRVADGEPGYGRTALRFGVLWFAIPAILGLLAGGWLLMSLPAELARSLLAAAEGGARTWIWTSAGATAAAVALTAVALAAGEPRQYVVGAAASWLGALWAEGRLNDSIREFALAGAEAAIPTASAALPAGPAGMFAAVAGACALALGYLLWATSGARRLGG